jgi:hypothetical protein
MDIKRFQERIAAPNIMGVVDSQGISIPNPGTTLDTALVLSGTATASVVVTILDYGSPVGTASVTTAGTWEKSATAVVGRHEYTVREGTTLSQPWVVTVTAVEEKPIITGVKGASGPVDNGGTTTDTTLTLSGTATPNTNIEILDAGVPKGTAAVDGNGSWTTVAIVFVVGGHSLTARRVGGTLVSDPWTLTVNTATPPLNFNTSPATLNGVTYFERTWGRLPAFPPGAIVTRQASGGVPPYSYSSSASNIAVVDQLGTVTVRANGSTVITVRDSASQSKSFSVTVQNVFDIVFVKHSNWNNAGTGHPAGGHLPSLAEFRTFKTQYGVTLPFGWEWYWTSEAANSLSAYAVAPDNEQPWLKTYNYLVSSIKLS